MKAAIFRGGDIVVEAMPNLHTLIDYRYAQHFKAKPGVGGMGKDRHGAGGSRRADRIDAVAIGRRQRRPVHRPRSR